MLNADNIQPELLAQWLRMSCSGLIESPQQIYLLDDLKALTVSSIK